MAQHISPLPISGKVGNLQLSIRNGKNFVHPARDYSQRHKHRMNSPKCASYRMNLREFAAASMIASQIYSELPRVGFSNPINPGPILRPYTHNHLTARIKACGQHKQKQAINGTGSFWYATEFRTPDIALALKDLDLSKGAEPAREIRLTALGPAHNPTEVRITGFTRAAQHVRTAKCIRLECRIHILQAAFTERVWSQQANDWDEVPNLRPDGQPAQEPDILVPSDWIPVEIIPEQGIKIPIPECDEGSKHITAVLIEWREHRGFGRRIVRLHDKGIVRIASVHAPAAAFQEVAAEIHYTQPQHLIPVSLARIASEPTWRKNPEEFLIQAISKIGRFEYKGTDSPQHFNDKYQQPRPLKSPIQKAPAPPVRQPAIFRKGLAQHHPPTVMLTSDPTNQLIQSLSVTNP
ncbi:MAG: hypothetical protein U0176_04180 [Bacteroidia bacterium]